MIKKFDLKNVEHGVQMMEGTSIKMLESFLNFPLRIGDFLDKKQMGPTFTKSDMGLPGLCRGPIYYQSWHFSTFSTYYLLAFRLPKKALVGKVKTSIHSHT